LWYHPSQKHHVTTHRHFVAYNGDSSAIFSLLLLIVVIIIRLATIELGREWFIVDNDKEQLGSSPSLDLVVLIDRFVDDGHVHNELVSRLVHDATCCGRLWRWRICCRLVFESDEYVRVIVAVCYRSQ
jgi:hypothetical protein